MAFFICLCIPLIRDPFTRKAFGTVTGVLLGLYTYGVSFLSLIAYVTIGWLQIKLLPARMAPYTVLTIGSILLLMRHYYTWLNDQEGTGVSDRIPFMIAAIKLSYVAFNYKDA